MNPYMLKAPPLTADALERIATAVPAHRHDERTDPDRFTLREAIAHMADWEPIFLERIQNAVEHDDYQIVPYDESELAEKNGYAHQDVMQSIAKFRADRQRTLAYVRGLTREQLDRPVVHPELGSMRVSDIVNQLSGHDLYHLEHLTQYLLGKTAGTW